MTHIKQFHEQEAVLNFIFYNNKSSYINFIMLEKITVTVPK